MERVKLDRAKKTGAVNARSGRATVNKAERKPKAEKLVCRYCGSDDLAPSFIKRRDRRCRKCFSKRYGSASPAKTKKTKKECQELQEGSGAQRSILFLLRNILGPRVAVAEAVLIFQFASLDAGATQFLASNPQADNPTFDCRLVDENRG